MVHRIALGATLLLCGCSLIGPSPQARNGQPKLELLVQASEGLNPNVERRPAPILLRIYELRAPHVFKEADFFALNDTDRATLGSDLIGVDQVVLRPGERFAVSRVANPETRAIGVFAGYRDLPHSTWRAVHVLAQSSETRWYSNLLATESVELRIDLQPNAILITDRRQAGHGAQSPLSVPPPRLIEFLPEGRAAGEGARRPTLTTHRSTP